MQEAADARVADALLPDERSPWPADEHRCDGGSGGQDGSVHDPFDDIDEYLDDLQAGEAMAPRGESDTVDCTTEPQSVPEAPSAHAQPQRLAQRSLLPTRFQQAPKSDRRVTALYGNITEWGQKIHKFLASQKQYNLCMFVETHLDEERTAEVRNSVRKDGWKMVATPARASGKSDKGTSAGEAVFARLHAATSSFEHLVKFRPPGAAAPFHGFSALVWHLKGGNVVMVCTYLVPKEGLATGANAKTLRALMAFVKSLADPYVIVGDWNHSPAQIAKARIHEFLRGVVLTPPCAVTCDKGKGSMIDFAIVSECLKERVTLSPVVDVPWKTHCGIAVSFERSEQPIWYQKLQLPRELPQVDRPRKRADPGSKSSLRREEARLARRARLAPELREAFDLNHPSPAEVDAQQVGPDYRVTDEVWQQAKVLVESRSQGRRHGQGGVGEQLTEHPKAPPARQSQPCDRSTATSDRLACAVEPDGKAVVESRSSPGDARLPRENLGTPWFPLFIGRGGGEDDGNGVARHFLHAARPEATLRVNAMYASWVSCVEVAILRTSQIEEADWAPFLGRAQGFALVWQRASASPGRAHLVFGAAEWWAVSTTLLKRAVSLRNSGKDEDQLSQCMNKLRKQCEQLEGQDLSEFFGRDMRELFDTTVACLYDLSVQSDEELPALVEAADRLSACAHARGIASSRRAFERWAKEQWEKKPGVLHRHVKQDPPAPVESLLPGSVVSDPSAIMADKQKMWQKKWLDPVDTQQDLQEAISGALRRAGEDPLDPIEASQLSSLWQRAPAKKAPGIDVLRVADVQRLPQQGVEELTALLNSIELAGVWPEQVFATICALLPKPNERGDRTIGMISNVIKLWSRVRSGLIEEWSSGLEQFWDTAIKGSSALRSALLRSLLDETAVLAGVQVATLLLDIEKFYDSLSLVILIRIAADVGFPGVVVALEAQVYLAPRFLRSQGKASVAIHPTRSVVAGSCLGVPLAKLFLFPILDRTHRQVKVCRLWSYIDDTVSRAEGTAECVTLAVQASARVLSEGLREARLDISDKTTVLATSSQLRARISQALTRDGVPHVTDVSAVDLGCDTTVGKSRILRRAKARLDKASKRFRRIRRLRRSAKLSKISQSLWSMGALPQAVYGHQIYGVSPSSIRTLRRQAGQAIAGTGSGRCLTTLLAMHLGTKDPGLELRRQLVLEFCIVWKSSPELHDRIRAAWRHLTPRLWPSKFRWARVKGPISAVIATLYEAGWTPAYPDAWRRPTADGSEVWRLPCASDEGFSQGDADFSDLLSDLVQDLGTQFWTQAAEHYGGEGLELGGGDVLLASREVRKFLSQEKYDLVGLQNAAVSGRQFTRQRQADLGYDVDTVCPRCNQSVETLYHRVWECPCNVGFEEFEKSECLRQQAQAQWESCPVLWLRGVPPKSYTHLSVFPDENLRTLGRTPISAVEPYPSFGCVVVFGDGSGGAHSADPRRRRCGTAVIAMQPNGQGGWRLAWGISTPLGGQRQTVPRSELLAFAIALEQVPMEFLFVTDHEPLVKSWGQSRHLQKNGANQDLWSRIRVALEARTAGVSLKWIPSHLDDASPASGDLVDPFLIQGNALADEEAGTAARLGWATSVEGGEPSTDHWDAVGTLVRARARRALALAAEADPWSGSRPTVQRVAPPSKLKVAVRASSHSFERCDASWRCAVCDIVVPASRLIEAASTQCRGLPVCAVGAGGGELAAGRAVHSSHSVQRWERFLMTFCTVCGKYATLDGRHLAAPCEGRNSQISRKGRENLSRIEAGLYPRREGVPKALQAALDARDRAALREGVCAGPSNGGESEPSAAAG